MPPPKKHKGITIPKESSFTNRDFDKETVESLSQELQVANKEIERLKAIIAERDERIEELEQQLSSL
jgi:predicted  nucleic acid-binding Zn-ribbon protein